MVIAACFVSGLYRAVAPELVAAGVPVDTIVIGMALAPIAAMGLAWFVVRSCGT